MVESNGRPEKILACRFKKTLVMIFKRQYEYKLTPHFKASEFYCKCNICNPQLISRDLVDRLEELRLDVGKPIVINSGYRCSNHNKNISGAPKSKHMQGCAADIKVKGLTGSELAMLAERYFKGIGIAKSWIHVDTRVRRAEWYYD